MELLQALSTATPEELVVWRGLVERVGVAKLAAWLSPSALVGAMLADTAFSAEMLESLRNGDAGPLASALPEVAVLAVPMPPQVEHDAGTDRPLLDHVATRLLGRKLRGLETRDLARFQDRGLSREVFDGLAATCERVIAAGLGPAMRVAIMHLDIAKTPSASHRTTWAAQGVSVDVHNEAAAAILRKADRARTWPLPEVLGKLAIAWVESHGLAGQHVRGEGPLLMFAPLVASLRDLAPALGRVLGVPAPSAVRLALDALHVIDACDTGAVREGLLDDALLARLAGVRDKLASVCVAPAWANPQVALAALAPKPDREWLADRLRALRAGRQRAGEPASAVDAAVAAVGDSEMLALAPALANCQLWYCEAATSGLSPQGQLAVLAAAVGAARGRGTRSYGHSSRGCTVTARAHAIGCGSSRRCSRRHRCARCSPAVRTSARSEHSPAGSRTRPTSTRSSSITSTATRAPRSSRCSASTRRARSSRITRC